MDDLSVNLHKLQIGCFYSGTIMNHMMYAEEFFVFSPSVSGLRKLIDCCAKYGNMFDITYNANKSFCMVSDNKPGDMKNINPVVINNHTLPHTEKCKYLGHIINNNLTDDDDIARQKRCIYAQANVLARKFNLCNSTIKTTLFNSHCGSMYTSSLWCNLKNQSLKVLLLLITTVLELYTTCHAAVVQVICSLLFMLNPLTNAFARQYLAFYAG